MANYAIRDPDEAMDIVQDAMIKLVSSYADRPAKEWPALFHRILQNRIRDFQRRQNVRQKVMSWMPISRDAEQAGVDPIQSAPDLAPDAQPDQLAVQDDLAEAMDAAVAQLPPRQQQTFMLRAWEGLDVASTAAAMGCSQGSVKTHYSRAVHALREKLQSHLKVQEKQE